MVAMCVGSITFGVTLDLQCRKGRVRTLSRDVCWHRVQAECVLRASWEGLSEQMTTIAVDHRLQMLITSRVVTKEISGFICVVWGTGGCAWMAWLWIYCYLQVDFGENSRLPRFQLRHCDLVWLIQLLQHINYWACIKITSPAMDWGGPSPALHMLTDSRNQHSPQINECREHTVLLSSSLTMRP